MAETCLTLQIQHQGLGAWIGNESLLIPWPQDNEQETDLFGRALGVLAEQYDLSSCSRAVMLVPDRQFFFRLNSFPFTSSSKIGKVLPMALQSGFPDGQVPMLTDFSMVGTGIEKGSCWVSSASIEKEKIRAWALGVKVLNIKLFGVLPRTAALAALWLKPKKSIQDLIFLDISQDQVTLLAAVNRRPVLVRHFSRQAAGPKSLAAAVNQTVLGINQRMAYWIDPELVITGTQNDPLVQEAARAMEAGVAQTLSDLRLTLENQAGLEQMLAQEAQIPDCFNLCQGVYGQGAFLKAYGRSILGSGLLAALVFIVFMAGIWSENERLNTQVTHKQQIISEIFKQSFPLKKMGGIDPLLLMEASVRDLTRNTQSTLKDPLANLSGLKAGQIILELSRQIPKSVDLEISRLMLDKGRLMLSGSADNFNTVDRAKNLIAASPLFKKVEISSAVAGKNNIRVDFKLHIEI